MSDFCVKCSDKEAQIELLTKKHFAEMQCCKERIENLKNENERLRRQNEALILDVAFYNKDILTPKES